MLTRGKGEETEKEGDRERAHKKRTDYRKLCVVHKSADLNFQRRQSNRNDERRRSVGRTGDRQSDFVENSLSNGDTRANEQFRRRLRRQRELATRSSSGKPRDTRKAVFCGVATRDNCFISYRVPLFLLVHPAKKFANRSSVRVAAA